jgi:hypothetical protein
MTAKIYKFPGYLLPDDGVSVLKDGKRWPNTDALLDSLTLAERLATSHWTTKRFRDGPVTYRDAPVTGGGNAA